MVNTRLDSVYFARHPAVNWDAIVGSQKKRRLHSGVDHLLKETVINDHMMTNKEIKLFMNPNLFP